jgi:hypothetical protein
MTKEGIEELKKDLKEESSLLEREIAEKHGISVSTLAKYRKIFNLYKTSSRPREGKRQIFGILAGPTVESVKVFFPEDLLQEIDYFAGKKKLNRDDMILSIFNLGMQYLRETEG